MKRLPSIAEEDKRSYPRSFRMEIIRMISVKSGIWNPKGWPSGQACGFKGILSLEVSSSNPPRYYFFLGASHSGISRELTAQCMEWCWTLDQ
jgi:hypothetical protein